jgi:ABC-2 type transport system ATP-binding protein
MLDVRDVYAGYPEKLVLKGVSLHLPQGAVHGLVGRNGAGKTTLLQTLYGLIRPQTGTLSWRSQPLHRRDVGYLETDPFFYSGITAREHLRLFGKQDDDAWADLLQLPLDELASNYSTGMRKKLALLSVIKTDKSLLLLDEPFNGLDLESQYLLRDILLRLKKQGKTVLVTSHILESLTPVCEAIHFLSEGTVQQTVLPEGFQAFSQWLHEDMEERHREGLDRVF